VLLGNYPAEYGRASGGVINAITKSGTNGFHGAAYWFIREKGLDARNYFDTTLPPFHRNQFGASGGGAIIKNKTFIFADYEGIRQDKSDTFTNVVPSAAIRQGQLCSIPQPGPNGCQKSQLSGAFNPDPATGIDKAVLPYLAFFPLPNAGLIGNGDTGNFNTSGIERLTENYFTARVDHHFSDKDSLDGSYFFDNAPLTTPDSLVDVLNENFTRRQMVGLEETHIFSPRLVNTARLGFSRVRALVTAPLTALNPLQGRKSRRGPRPICASPQHTWHRADVRRPG
jgi:outer membrane receptor protein involved in Fe transport